MAKKSRHHVYPHKWRISGKNTEIKKVDPRDHQDWHMLARDYHPEEAIRKIYSAMFGEGIYLNDKEEKALLRLSRGKTKEETFVYLVQNFLPSETYYQSMVKSPLSNF